MSTDTAPGRDVTAVLGKAPLVGRVAEREVISAALQRAVAESRPQLVTIVGDRGIGKSRLVTEAIADLMVQIPDLRSYRGHCRPESEPGALARMLRTRLGLIDGLDTEAQISEMRARLSELFGDRRVQEILHFLGAFIGVKIAGTPIAEAVEEDSRAFQHVARAVLRRFFEVDAQRSPMILVFEDLHDASAEGVTLLRQLIEPMTNAPLVVIVTTRPELLASVRVWPSVLHDRHARIDLGPLNRDERQTLARALLSRAPDVPSALTNAAADLGGGNPLLTEQLCRIFFDQRLISIDNKGVAHYAIERLAELSLPMNVEDAARSRLATLNPAEREMLEMAAVMGTTFWLGGLVVLGRVSKPVPELWGGREDLAPHFRDMLYSLEQRDYVVRVAEGSIGGDEEWIFRQRLERETLAKLVPAETAQAWHLILAEWFEFRLVERDEEHLDLLAHHYEHGIRSLRAARCYLESADRARARYANMKAVESYEKGMGLLGEHDVRLRLDAHHHLGDVLQTLGRTDDAMAEFRKMLELAFRLDLKAKGGAAHNRIGRLHRDTGRLDLAMKHLGTALALFEGASDERGIASSYDDIGKVHWMRGDYEQSLRYLQDALTRREALGDPRSIALSLNNIGLVFQDSGQYKAAFDALSRALDIRREIEDLQGVTATLNNLGTIHQDKGDDREAIRLWIEALDVARETGDRKRQAILMLNIGEGQYRLRNPEEAIRILSEVEEVCGELNDRILLAEAWRGLGKAQLLRGNVAIAKQYLERAVEGFEATRSKIHVGIAKRTLGECLATYGYGSEPAHRAESLYRQALDIFEEAGNELEFARTAKAFAHLLRQSTEPSSAHSDEAAQLQMRADEIFSKLDISDFAVEPASVFGHDGDWPHAVADDTTEMEAAPENPAQITAKRLISDVPNPDSNQ